MEKEKGSVHARRFIAYLVLIILTVLCLVWFYILIINATRSKNDLRVNGFSAIPSTHLMENLNNLFRL